MRRAIYSTDVTNGDPPIPPGAGIIQRLSKRVEEIFGWTNPSDGGQWRPRRGEPFG